MARNSSAAARRGSLQAGAAPVSVSTAAKGASASAGGHHHGQLGAGRHRGLGQALLQHRVEGPAGGGQQHPQIALAEGQSRQHIGVAARQHRQHAAQRQQAGHARGRQGLAPDQRFQQRYQDGAAREDQRDIRGAGVLRADGGATATPMPSTARGSSEGRPRRSAWRCRYSAGAAIGSRISSAISQRPKARKTGKGGVVGPSGRHHVGGEKRGALKAWPCRQGPGWGVLRVLRCEA